MSIYETNCILCSSSCQIKVLIEKEKLAKVTGGLCPKARLIPDVIYAPDRLLSPLERKGKKWETISWEKAFKIIAKKLDSLREIYGPRSLGISFYRGRTFWRNNLEELVRRFGDLYGACLFSGASPMCQDPMQMGFGFTVGTSIGMDLSSETKSLICWGTNPVHSKISLYPRILNAKKNGLKLIVIDPRSTETAKQADIHVKIRPGTDLALLLGILNVIISKKMYDKDFIRSWTVGFDKLVTHVRDYPIEKVEEITQVPADLIEKIALIYASNKPSALLYGDSMWSQHTNNFQAIRAYAILIAITGNLDVKGGNIFGVEFPPVSMGRIISRRWGSKRIPISENWRPGATEYNLYCDTHELAQPQRVLDAILYGKPFPIRAAIIFSHNPALILPNSKRVVKALSSLDFLVVMDHFMTDTAKLADVVLPATFSLETDGFYTRSTGEVKVIKKAVNPPGECISDMMFWCELGRRMGYGEYFPWISDEEYCDNLLFSIKNAKGYYGEEQHDWINRYYLKEKVYRRYEREGFRTHSGKVEIYSEYLKGLGISPLPVYKEPAESPLSRPDIAKKYPLICTTGARRREYMHSQSRNIPSIRALYPENILEISPKDASKLNIEDGDLVIVESERGSIKIKARYSDILEGVISLMHGWSDANANILTDDASLDPVTGSPGTKSFLCKVVKVK